MREVIWLSELVFRGLRRTSDDEVEVGSFQCYVESSKYALFTSLLIHLFFGFLSEIFRYSQVESDLLSETSKFLLVFTSHY